MNKPIWIGLFFGTTIGSFIPSIWGAGEFSLWGALFSMIGGGIGIWLGFKMQQN